MTDVRTRRSTVVRINDRGPFARGRTIDALAAAGGVTADADTTALNRAAVLRDGMRIYVPRHGEELQTRGLVTARVFADIRELVSTR